MCSSRSTVTLVRMSLHSWRALAVARLDDIRTPGILVMSRENSSERLDWSWPMCSKALAQIARHCLVLSFSSCNRSRSAATSSEIDGEEWICISRRCFSSLVIFVIVFWISFVCFTVPGGRLSHVIFCIVINGWPYREMGALLYIFDYLESHECYFRADWFESRGSSHYRVS